MTRCRLVALDVDGTLMSYDGVISDEVRDGGRAPCGTRVCTWCWRRAAACTRPRPSRRSSG